jgi:hypothetical protein
MPQITPKCPNCSSRLSFFQVAFLTNLNTTTCKSCGSSLGLNRGNSSFKVAVFLLALYSSEPILRLFVPPQSLQVISWLVVLLLFIVGFFAMVSFAQLEVREKPEKINRPIWQKIMLYLVLPVTLVFGTLFLVVYFVRP